MARVKYVKCDICGRHITENSFDSAIRFFAGIIHNGKIDICESCLGKIDKIYEDIRTEEELVEYAMNSKNAEDFKEKSRFIFSLFDWCSRCSRVFKPTSSNKGEI